MITKINNIFRGALAGCAALIGLSACSDFLEIKSQTEIVLEDFWNEKADVDNIVAGCYSGLQADGVMARMMVWGEFRSDNVMPGQNITSNLNLENVLKENITASNYYTTWDGFYNVINRCNTVIKYAPGVAAEDPGYTESELRATIAEVSALRDLCYFYLIRTFRDVPYSTVAYTDDDQVMDLPATPFYDVLDSLINDLENVKGDAIVRYPDSKPAYQTGRITRDAIYAMLCEMYLWKKDYDNCIRYADLIIQSKKDWYEENYRTLSTTSSLMGQSSTLTRTNGFPLENEQISGSNFGNAYQAIFVNGRSFETIFELAFSDNPRADQMLSNGAVGGFYGNQDVTTGLVAPSTAVTEDIEKSTSRTIFDDRNKRLDARLYETVNSENSSIVKYVNRSVSINAASSPPKVTYGSKFPTNDNGTKWIIYRLPDIMLLKAEAICQKLQDGSDQSTVDYNAPLLAQCFTLVNAINKRSLCQVNLQDTLVAGDYMTKLQMEELVLRERQRELMFEGKRWYDLVRRSMRDGNTDILSQAAMRRDAINGQFVQSFFKKMDAIFWPYNLEETKVNLNLVQNPSFGTGENSSYEKTK